MNCPACHKIDLKNQDFYYKKEHRGKVYPECKECVKKKKQKHQKKDTSLFDIKEFAKHYR